MAAVRSEFNVKLVVDPDVRASSIVRGRVESCYGQHAFSGWLELLGQLEGLVDRAREDAERALEGERR